MQTLDRIMLSLLLALAGPAITGCNTPGHRPPPSNTDYGLDEPDDVPPADPEGWPDPDEEPDPGASAFSDFTASSDASDDSGASDEWPILFRYSGLHAGRQVAMRVVARDEATFRQLGLPEVNVDWDKEMVLVAALGRTPQPDMMVEIERIDQKGSTLVPRVRLARLLPGDAPDTKDMPFAEMRCPYELVIVPMSDKNVVGFSTRAPANVEQDLRRGLGSIPNPS